MWRGKIFKFVKCDPARHCDEQGAHHVVSWKVVAAVETFYTPRSYKQTHQEKRDPGKRDAQKGK